jgi:BASS family bile acid:Na+ symporter
MVLFFLSYLSIELKTVWSTLRGDIWMILPFIILKSLILPVIVYYIFKFFSPSFALAALLLTGASTGVVAPFISNLVRGNSALVLVVAVITSILVPVTLPVLIQVIAAKHAQISLLAMIRLLLLVIFVPILMVEGLRRVTPHLLQQVIKVRFPVSLIFFAIINLGVFCQYSVLFRTEPVIIITASAVAVVLSVINCVVGISFFLKGPVENQLAGAVMMGNMNNVLIIVFSWAFFGATEALVAAMYIIPFFALVMPLRYYAQWYRRSTERDEAR